MELGFKQNVGPLERAVRFLAAMTLIGLTYFGVIRVSTFTAALLYIIAGFFLFVAFSGY